MPKYTIHVTLRSLDVIIDTDDFEDDFAKTKDDLVDKLDASDPDVVHDWFRDNWADYDLIDPADVEPDAVTVKAAK